MSRNYEPLIPQTIDEVDDRLAWMLSYAPLFRHYDFQTGDIERVFFELKEGLGVLRVRLGEELYLALISMSDRARALFEADPRDTTGQTTEGRKLIFQMQKVLRAGKGG